jgi:replication-associated recombination protein RarA
MTEKEAFRAKLGRNFERMSALQKCVRRSMTDEAGYWFFAMCNDGCGVMAFNRLKVIAHEDIGWRDMNTVLFVSKCADDGIEWLKLKKSGWELAGANAVLALCNARKCREADNFQAVCLGRLEQDPNKPIPDFAFDKHTRKGRAMGRGFDHFFKEGAKLVDPDGTTPAKDQWWEEAEYYFKKGYFDKKPASADDQADGEPGQSGAKGTNLFSFLL